MKLDCFEINGRLRLGAFEEERAIDLNAAYTAYLTAAGESNTSNRRFGFGEIIEFVTSFWTLVPGDVATAATPPAGPFEPDDIIEAEIEGIGVLTNPVGGVKLTPSLHNGST